MRERDSCFSVSSKQERMSLKHQNSGKWAKSKAIMAKYDDSVRIPVPYLKKIVYALSSVFIMSSRLISRGS